jgi:hypothetical protein
MKPTTTVAAGSASAGGSFAIIVILTYALGLYHITLPADVATAIGTLITIGVHYLVALFSAQKET